MHLIDGSYAMGEGVGNWDGHKKLKEQYDIHAPILDLRQRGLLDDTLVVWTTELSAA